MLPTAEVRWFWRGEPPDAARAWLDQRTGATVSRATRTDHYLEIATTDALGIKLREGQIELKQRMDGPVRRELADGVRGLTERWMKWSFEITTEYQTLGRLIASDAWVGIKKTRWLKAYRVSPLGDVQPTEQSEGQICTMEITEVSTPASPGNPWWTLGLEASGEIGQLTPLLLQVAAELLRPTFPAPLEEVYSYAHPHWLNLLRKGGDE